MFRGGWEGHDPEGTTEAVAAALRDEGVQVDIRDGTRCLSEPATLRGVGCVVPCVTMGELPAGSARPLLQHVRAGAGLAGWHGGAGDAFRSNSEYQFAVGGQFVAHPGDHKLYRVNVDDRVHPITRGVADFEVRSEQYYMHIDPANRVLASTVFDGVDAPWCEGVRMPVVWTKRYGAGRVAYSALGHDASEFGQGSPTLVLAARCILWALGVLR